jgi:hypothetical protein
MPAVFQVFLNISLATQGYLKKMTIAALIAAQTWLLYRGVVL